MIEKRQSKGIYGNKESQRSLEGTPDMIIYRGIMSKNLSVSTNGMGD